MAKINVLDASVFNRIAAGEVVERPASIVKELVENSIDAGASSCIVDIKNGGKDYIKISDNGCGIARSEVPKAFLPHATSKLLGVGDLENIGTLGFRGEALASIASVAKVKMVTKPSDEEIGTCIELFENVYQITDVGSPKGTYIVVEQLFEHIPARRKFLRNARQEESEITNLMTRLILANPNISFKYTADTKKICQSFGQGVDNAIHCIYGKETLSSTIAVQSEYFDIKLGGRIGKEEFSKANRTYQTLVINNRFVVNDVVASAVSDAYADRLMKRQYPFWVLYIEMPLSKIDVNVHPNKLEVRFWDNQQIYDLVYHTVADALKNNYAIPSVPQELPHRVLPFEAEAAIGARPALSKFNFVADGQKVTLNKNTDVEKDADQTKIFDRPTDLFARSASALKGDRAEQVYREDTETLVDFLDTDGTALQTSAETAAESNTHAQNDGAQQIQMYREITPIGVAFDTYLLIQCGDNIFMIDQHAAHERLLYDKLLSQINSASLVTQDLLLPYVFDVNHAEKLFLTEFGGEFARLGFGLEEFGALGYKISYVPAILTDIKLSRFVQTILEDLTHNTKKQTSDLMRFALMQEACKAAVKGGDKLSFDELSEIMRQISETDATLMCPHGRPIAVKIEKETVEKWFKRIVG